MKAPKEFLKMVAHFYQSSGSECFATNKYWNMIWSNPEYGGDNTIRKYEGTYDDWYNSLEVKHVEDKGRHITRKFCGKDIEII